MKLLFIATLIQLPFIASAQKKISIDQVSKQVKSANYVVLKDAQRVYQAKETINFSKRNLLPKLNFWNILKLPFDWSAAIEIVQDIAPFLVPANWFRVNESRYLYLAQKEQYRAVWANEIMTAKLLYYNALKDISFRDALEEQYNQIDNLIQIVEPRVVFGGTALQTLNFLKIRKLEVEDDLRIMDNVIHEEVRAISFLVGVDQDTNVQLSPIQLPDIEKLKPLDIKQFYYRALGYSPEVNQYAYISSALKYVKKEINFTFLGTSSIARSAGMGAFDHIPIQDGLGFERSSSLKITKSEGQILEINKTAAMEVIKKNLYILINNFNSYLQNIENPKERLEIAEANFDHLKSQLILGQDIAPMEILESIEATLEAKMAIEGYRYGVVNILEKLQRMIFNGDYESKEVKLDLLLTGGLK